MTRWIALLRGVNVGGGNRLPMADLRALAAEIGFGDVSTYIQSGNLILDAPVDEAEIASSLRSALADAYGLDVAVVVRSSTELARIAERHPDAGGPIEPKLLHVCFLDRAPDRGAEGPDPARYRPDGWTIDGREIFVRYPDGSARSKLTIDVFERAYGAIATARNLNTVRRLAALSRRA
jgi:uncharacterized protein (DUF1697 family)